VRRILLWSCILLVLRVAPLFAAPLSQEDTQKLHDEFTTDPLHLGYNVDPTKYVDNNADAQLQGIINLVRQGPEFQVSQVITNAQLWNATMSVDLENLPTPKRTLLQIALQVPAYDLGVEETYKKLLDIFPSTSVTYANVLALQKRNGTRAEVILRRGLIVSMANIACALRGTGCDQ